MIVLYGQKSKIFLIQNIIFIGTNKKHLLLFIIDTILKSFIKYS